MEESLLESTGHSFSGISKIIYDEPEKTKELLLEIDNRYNNIINEQLELEKKLNQLKNKKSYIISDFNYLHKALKLNENESISFVNNGYFIEIKIYPEFNYNINKINIIL